MAGRVTLHSRRVFIEPASPNTQTSVLGRRTLVLPEAPTPRTTRLVRRVLLADWPKGTGTIDAVIKATITVLGVTGETPGPPAYGTIDAFFPGGQVTVESSFPVSAAIKAPRSGSFTAAAVITKTQSRTTTVDAAISGRIDVNAYIAWWFRVNATTRKTQEGSFTVAAIRRETFPESFSVEAAKSGRIDVSAFVQPWFTVGAWIGDPPVLASATQLPVEAVVLPTTAKARLTQLPVEAVIELPPPTGRLTHLPVEVVVRLAALSARLSQLAAEIVVTSSTNSGRVTQLVAEAVVSSDPKTARAGEFDLRAWLFRYEETIPGTITVDAILGTTWDPVVLATQIAAETVVLPTSQQARLTQLPVELVISRFPSFSLRGIVLGPVPDAAFSLDAEIWPRHAWASAVLLQPEITGQPFDLYAEAQRGFDIAAIIPPYFKVTASIKTPTIGAPWHVDAWLIYRIYGSFTVNAKVGPHLRADAVIKRPGQRYHARVDAVVSAATRAGTFAVNAHKIRPWGSFVLDAIRRRPTPFSVPADAVIVAVAGTRERTVTLDAIINSPYPYSRGILWVESWIDAERTVVYEGEGETTTVRTRVGEHLSFPGYHDSVLGYTTDTSNNLSTPFYPPLGEPVTVTLYDLSAWRIIGVHSLQENHRKAQSAPGTFVFYPSANWELHAVFLDGGYDPTLTGAGIVHYSRDDEVVLSLPAPTLDAWLVGTVGESWTVDAEIVGREKAGLFAIMAETSPVGERRDLFSASAHIAATISYVFAVGATLRNAFFTAGASIYQPHGTIDAYIAPWFHLDAVILDPTRYILWTVNAVIWGPTVYRAGSFKVNAYKTRAKMFSFGASAVVKATSLSVFSDTFTRSSDDGLGGEWTGIRRHMGGATYFPDYDPPFDIIVDGSRARTRAEPFAGLEMGQFPWIRERFHHPLLALDRLTVQFDFLTTSVFDENASNGENGYVIQTGSTTYFLSTSGIGGPSRSHDKASSFVIDSRIGIFDDPVPPATSFSVEAEIGPVPNSLFSSIEYQLADAVSGFVVRNYPEGAQTVDDFYKGKYLPQWRLDKETWYTLKLEINEYESSPGVPGPQDRYKIWRAGTPEPDEWFEMAMYHLDGSLWQYAKHEHSYDLYHEISDGILREDHVPGSDYQNSGAYYWHPPTSISGSGMWWEGGYLEMGVQISQSYGGWDDQTLQNIFIGQKLNLSGIDNVVIYPTGFDAFFTVGATICDADGLFPGRVGGMTADALIEPIHRFGSFELSALVGGPIVKLRRFSMEGKIVGLPSTFTLDASVAPWISVGAYIQPWFTLSAFIRGSAYIIFPEGGGDPTDPYGNEPMIGRSFKVKVEAGIAPDVGVGNDAEIERLITLILEAERELEAMYCAWTHYKPQDATAPSVRPYNSNPSGTGYNRGSLPGALNQVVYPGAGDVDDCWVVATVWAALAAGETFKPTVPYFRAKARNPDRPGPTGGTGYHVWLGARGCWPNHKIKKYTSTSWDGFISLLKAGWTASLAVRSSGLPSTYRYGFNGLHQVGVAYQDGKYWLMNPLQPNGSRPREISGLALRTAALGFSGGTISATLFA